MSRFFALFFTLFSATILLFAPIVQEFSVYGDLSEKKLTFSIRLFGIIKILGGYASAYRGGIALHVSKKKAILLPYSGMNEQRKKFKILRSFRLISMEASTETGIEYVTFAALIYTLSKTFFTIKGFRNKGNVKLFLSDGDVLRVSVRIIAYFQLAVLLSLFFRFLFKIVVRRIKKIWKKEKLTV